MTTITTTTLTPTTKHTRPGNGNGTTYDTDDDAGVGRLAGVPDAHSTAVLLTMVSYKRGMATTARLTNILIDMEWFALARCVSAPQGRGRGWCLLCTA